MLEHVTVSKKPALPTILLFIAGILLQPVLIDHPWLCSAIAFGLALILARFVSRTAVANFALACGIVVAGASDASLSRFDFPSDHIGLFTSADPHLAQIEVQVDDIPRVTSDPRRKHLPPRTSFPGTVRRIQTWNGWIDACGSIQVSVSEPVPGLQSGQIVRLTGLLQHPSPAMNPGQFDWAAYYRSQRMLAQLHVGHACDVQILKSSNRASLPGLRQLVSQALQSGVPPEREVDGALLGALVLGQRGPLLQHVGDDFRHTGASHLLASSGARVAIFSGFIFLICRILLLSPRTTAVIVTVAIALLGLLMFPAPQALRPVLLGVALCIALLGRRSVDPVQLLALAALGILVVQPLDLFNAGFQLSFVIVAGMLLLTRPFLDFLRSLESPDRRATRDLVLQTTRGRICAWLVNGARNTFAAALVAWVVSLPLVAYHFEQFNLWAIPVGILLSPLVFAALVGGFAKIALTVLFPPGAGIWAFAALGPPSCLRHAVGWMARLPLADLPVSSPSLWTIFLFYGLICWPLIARSALASRIVERLAKDLPRLGGRLHFLARPANWLRRSAPLAACVLIAWSPLRNAMAGPPASGKVRVTLLSVGAGQCAVVEPPDGRTVLIDAGSSTLSDPMRHLAGAVSPP